jgi:hypothetical protein
MFSLPSDLERDVRDILHFRFPTSFIAALRFPMEYFELDLVFHVVKRDGHVARHLV